MTQRQLIALIKQFSRSRGPQGSLIIIVIAIIVYFVSSQLSGNKQSSATGTECRVTSIYDGDTMTLQCPTSAEKTKVRMYCIDAPEMKQAPWGVTARDYLRSIAGDRVELVKIDKDRYGRIVGELYSKGVNLNLAQVEAGQVAVYDAYCKKSEYKQAENQAKAAKKGIWAKSGTHQTPWEWRKN